jgi:LCP family protein required for cell wall assembly
VDGRTQRSNYTSVDGFVGPKRINRHQPVRAAAQPAQASITPVLPKQPIPAPNLQKATEASPRKPQRGRWSRRRKVTLSILTILFIGFGVGTWYGSRLIGNLDKVFHGNVFSDATALFSTTTLKGEANGRVNILLAGDSADDPGHAGADLTDSIMVLSIDTKDHTGFMLSIPRDLWVNIPGLSSDQKINAANDVTNFSQAGYPNGGMGELEDVVQTDLGIPIDYYALIDYTAFRDAVDAVNGITINIQSPDPRGLYDAYTHLKLPNGEVTLTGQQALDLARARGDDADGDISYGFPNSDYNRTQHQRQMLVALAQKAGTIGVLANPLKVTRLFDAFGNNIQTDFNLQDALRFVQITKGINLSNLQSLTYTDSGPNPLLTPYTDPGSGQEALIPAAGVDDFSQLQQYYQQLTSSNPVVREAPTVVVLNASKVIGLAHKQETALQADGFNVVAIADANNEYPGTMIVDNSNGQKPNSKSMLQKLYPGTVVTSDTSSTEAGEAQGYTANFVVVLGENWDNFNMQQP